MASEQTPLLAAHRNDKLDVYDRFSPARKRVIIAIVSWSGLIPLFVAGSFIPSIPQIAHDLNSTGTIVNLAVSLSILAVSLSSLMWATYSGFYGRRPIYLTSLPFLCIGSLGVALSQSIPQLMISRIVQAFGSSSGMSVGLGTIADIYRLEERGTAMGVFFGGILLGPALAPLAGGIATHYYTWRHMQYAIAGAGAFALALMVFYMPETSHPGARGIDRVTVLTGSKTRWVWLNPLRGLALLRSPNLMAVTVAGAFVLLSEYVLLIPLAYTIGERYNITNEALIGAFFLPEGLGSIVGAPLAGRLSDRVVVAWRARRGGRWVPEDRLRATLFGAAVLAPLSVLGAGLATSFVPGTAGIVLNLVCLFVNGVGVDFVLAPSAAYSVDVLYSRSAEIMAANHGFRGIILALASAGILPSINAFGIVATNVVAALLAWIGFALLWITIVYGARMRAWLDVGFSVRDT